MVWQKQCNIDYCPDEDRRWYALQETAIESCIESVWHDTICMKIAPRDRAVRYS